ncbi:MAG: hypothetical protein JST00_16375 [Deltaproteobacteria bacterium]|nr:hypothetical protein [Deltaproteobacteria bacterium]
MKTTIDTGVEEKEQWRDRILRALAELRAEDNAKIGRMRRDDARDDGHANDVNG